MFKASFSQIMDSSAQEKPSLLPRKIKPIPRKTSKIINDQKDFKVLIKKGLQVKNLTINQESYHRASQLVKVSKNFSNTKRLTKYCPSLQGLQINKVCKQDISCLLKLQCNLRHLRIFKADETYLIKPFTHQILRKFLFRSKHLHSYENTPIAEIVSRKCLPRKQELSFTFNLKRSININNRNRVERFITALSVRSSALTHVSGNNKSIVMGIIIPTDGKSEKFKEDVKMLNHGLNRISFLDSINIPDYLEDRVYDLLPLFNVNQLKVRTRLTLTVFPKKECKKVIEKFLSRPGGKLEIRTFNYSWANLVEMLTLSQQMFVRFGSCFTFSNFTFNFHAPQDVKQALINHFSVMETKWEIFTFIFKTNSLDWFNEEKRLYLTEMMNEMLKEKHRNKYSEINYEIELNDDFSYEIYPKIIEQIRLVIQQFTQDLQEKKITLKVNVQVKNNKSLLLFLNTVKEDFSNNLRSLELKIEETSSFKRLIEELRWLKYSAYSDRSILEKIERTKNYYKEAQELLGALKDIKQRGCCVNFVNSRETMESIEGWLSRFLILKQAEVCSSGIVCCKHFESSEVDKFFAF